MSVFWPLAIPARSRYRLMKSNLPFGTYLRHLGSAAMLNARCHRFIILEPMPGSPHESPWVPCPGLLNGSFCCPVGTAVM